MDEVWMAEPPRSVRPGRQGRYDWDTIVEQLMERPGEWLLVDEKASRGLASAIVKKKMRALRVEGWNFLVTTRNNNRKERTAEVWMTAERTD
jgi:hypothetical protein